MHEFMDTYTHAHAHTLTHTQHTHAMYTLRIHIHRHIVPCICVYIQYIIYCIHLVHRPACTFMLVCPYTHTCSRSFSLSHAHEVYPGPLMAARELAYCLPIRATLTTSNGVRINQEEILAAVATAASISSFLSRPKCMVRAVRTPEQHRLPGQYDLFNMGPGYTSVLCKDRERERGCVIQ